MLLDLREAASAAGLPRLLGSCPLSLAAVARDLLAAPLGGSTPSARAHRGVHPLHDLLGRPVGEISLGYRLMSLGGGLLRHICPVIPQEKAGEPTTLTEPRPPIDSSPADPIRITEQDSPFKLLPRPPIQPKDPVVPFAANEKREAVSVPEPPESVSIEPNSESDGGPPPVTPRKKHTALASTQTEPKSRGRAAPDRQELEIEANIFCPPPMYYTHLPTEQPPVRSLRQTEPTRLELQDELSSEDERSEHRPVQGPPKTKPTQRTAATSVPDIASKLGQLPLLNALLLELSLLNSDSTGPQSQHPCIHPQLAWLYRPTEHPSAPPTTLDKGGQRSPTHKLKRNRSDMSVATATPPSSPAKTQHVKETPKAKGPIKNSVGPTAGQPKKKLQYGLTNTLRLRLQKSNPDMLILHERREKLRKQQVQALKDKSTKSKSRGILAKSPRSPGQRRRRSHTRRARQGAHSASFDENIETLIQSSRTEDHDSSTSDIKHPEPNTRNEDLVLKLRNENTERTDYSNKRVTERVLPLSLPEALQQDSDSDGSIDHEGSSVHGKHGDSRSFSADGSQQSAQLSQRSSTGRNKSGDLIDSLEYTGYSDDFTSPDYTARFSEAMDSSPEPILLTTKTRYSDSDSESHNSSKSATSLKTTNIAAPMPVISNVSPVQSYKRALELEKPRGLIKAVKVADSDFRTSPENLDDQQIPLRSTQNKNKKGASNNTRTFTSDVGEYRDIENGHSFLETSKSVRSSQVSSYMPSSISDLELSVLGSVRSDLFRKDEPQSGLGTPDIFKQCKPMSELVVKQLPGYTL